MADFTLIPCKAHLNRVPSLDSLVVPLGILRVSPCLLLVANLRVNTMAVKGLLLALGEEPTGSQEDGQGLAPKAHPG